MQPQLLSQILAALNKDHNSTIYDLLIATLQSRDPSHNHHHDSILTCFPHRFDMLSEQSSNGFTTSVVKAATTACQEEIQTLILKQSGLHFDGSHTGLSQLKGFSIMELGQKVQQLVLHLWHLVGCLLDVVPDHHHTTPTERVVDEDIEMELAGIAAAVEVMMRGAKSQMTSGKMVRRLEGLRWMLWKIPTAMIWLARVMKCPRRKLRMRHSSQRSRNTTIESRIAHVVMLL